MNQFTRYHCHICLSKSSLIFFVISCQFIPQMSVFLISELIETWLSLLYAILINFESISLFQASHIITTYKTQQKYISWIFHWHLKPNISETKIHHLLFHKYSFLVSISLENNGSKNIFVQNKNWESYLSFSFSLTALFHTLQLIMLCSYFRNNSCICHH